MGRRFSNFDEAWAAFLAGVEPPESFYEILPEHEDATLDVWLIEPTESVKAAAAAAQRSFAHLDWIEPTPRHFLHVTIAHDTGTPPPEAEAFEIAYRRLNCFPEAVVVEVAGESLPSLAEPLRDLHHFLPHLTLGYVRAPGDAEELRAALAPLRGADLGTQRVDDVLLCRVPASRATILQPWRVLRRVRLRS